MLWILSNFTALLIVRVCWLRLLRGSLVSTYESSSVAHFKHGRTETIRSLTQEMKDFVLAFEDPAVSAQVKVEAFKKGSFFFGLGLIETQLLLDTLMSPRTPNLVRDKTGTCKASIGLLNNALSAFMIGKLRRYLIPLIGRPCLTDYLLPTLVEALQVCQQYLFLLFCFSMSTFIVAVICPLASWV